MANLSQIKRQRMLEFLSKIKEEHNDDETLIAIGEIENELNSKKYGLVWEKHEEQVDLMMQDNIPVFSEVKEKEITSTDDNSYNFLLEGDNLHSLKLLEKTHTGKIDVIYIDPPYNTNNKDFIYDDNYIGSDDGYRHSKWLSFMAERLKIAKELLSDEGVIFISIDDNEQAQLKLLCDEVFGEINFVANFSRSTRKGGGSMSKYVSTDHEYILLYCKDISKKSRFYVPFSDEYLKRYNECDEIGRFFWDTFARNRQGSSNVYSIKFPNGELIEKAWIYKEDKYLELLQKGEIRFKNLSNGKYSLQIKQRLNENGQIMRSEIRDYPNSLGTKTLVNLIGKDKFSYAKPIELIMYLLCSSNKDSVILDFFAGSGTTGHAVMQLNKEDGGNRKYILCTNNENNICEEVTYQRLKNIQGDLPHNLKYFKTDFISKDSDDVTEELLSHIKEMVELENGITLDNKKHLIVLSDEEVDRLEKDWDNYNEVEAIYVSRNVLFTTSQNALLSNVEIHIIPDYYFEYELKEVGESW
ncbi:site-specific DNA-methyltransferase [uncultured Parvimonas sp.]|uniref:site-specific DNA-methyltransferase n=1 Tax=uncultured Parvimonas sp. TaxID=747372 RepID=UPI00325FB565